DPVLDRDTLEGIQPVDVDQSLGLRQAHVQRRHEALPPCQDARLVPVPGQQLENLFEAFRPNVPAPERLHPPPPSTFAPPPRTGARVMVPSSPPAAQVPASEIAHELSGDGCLAGRLPISMRGTRAMQHGNRDEEE